MVATIAYLLAFTLTSTYTYKNTGIPVNHFEQDTMTYKYLPSQEPHIGCKLYNDFNLSMP